MRFFWCGNSEPPLYTSLLGCIKNAGLFERIDQHMIIGYQDCKLYETNCNLCEFTFNLENHSISYKRAYEAAICIETITDIEEHDGQGYWECIDSYVDLQDSNIRLNTRWTWISLAPPYTPIYNYLSTIRNHSKEEVSSVDWFKEGF